MQFKTKSYILLGFFALFILTGMIVPPLVMRAYMLPSPAVIYAASADPGSLASPQRH